MSLEINQKLPKKLMSLLGSCDKYLCYQMIYPDLERKLPCRDSDHGWLYLWVSHRLTHEYL
jgi:hypothetical protein